jgi:ammonium transporter, Amt family
MRDYNSRELTIMSKLVKWIGAAGVTAFAALPAFAQEAAQQVADVAATAAAEAAPAAAAFAPTADMVNKGDTAWMLMSSVLVLMMSVPALALFYGGLVRTKNMLSVLMQVFMIVSIAALVWVGWGYSMAFTSGGSGAMAPFVGSFDKIFLIGVDATTLAATFSNHVYLPEYVFVIFQMTFACITPALIVGAFAERVKFSSLMVFTVLWLTIVYFPVAHMVWYWAGTVVHINAGIAGLVGCLMIGKRVGFGKEATPPHSLTMTMIGASLLWVGWFGFNAGSNLEANGIAGVAFINTFVATAAAAVSWSIVEQIKHGKPSLLGAVSGAVAGLVAITPASGFAHPGTSILMGFLVSPICYFFIASVKNKFKYDDTLDVFGIHCIGGIVGAILTGVVADPALGGQGWIDYTAVVAKAGEYDMAGQVITQIKAVVLTLLWSGIGSAILFFIIDKTMGLRPSEEAEREGLDLSSHGERAYNY